MTRPIVTSIVYDMSLRRLSLPPVISPPTILNEVITKGPFLSLKYTQIFMLYSYVLKRKASDRQCIERAVMKVCTTFTATVYADTQHV